MNKIDDGGPVELPISLRDYFAAHAPPMHNSFWDSWRGAEMIDRLAANAAWNYRHADAMLRERVKQPAL